MKINENRRNIHENQRKYVTKICENTDQKNGRNLFGGQGNRILGLNQWKPTGNLTKAYANLMGIQY